ncbi:hypothetical protein [Candidatus Nanohalobium constans]|uniref:Uncharacterized protein n=1 Tax=Candidatus Nanohalobium constans TaxID=2565781 RepID=A0A5Q0UGL5_9ARCH|nr:hypothetical protein [Candidatus Nanohalobium constans]QGA80350.1 hypothetical protein LC1Nh_0449 [Candidatus Nanohalobium constans]
MINQITQQLDISSILLVAALIAAFVIAFKVMEMIFDTMLIAGISATFYIGLRMIQGGPISINDVLLFTFLGASLYMTYSLLASLYKLGATVLPIPVHIIEAALKPLQYTWSKIEELKERDDFAPKQTNSQKQKKQKEEEKDKSEKSTKEVILGNKDKEDEDEE